MRTRSREINIFNLSLMDVICGAMGAFLIIMIILARFYVFDPDVTEDADELKLRLETAVQGLNRIRGGTEGIITELIDEADSTTSGPGSGDTIEQIENLTQGIRQDIDLVRGQLGAVQAEANRLEANLQEKNAQLERAVELVSRLEIRRPLVVEARWNCAANVDLTLDSDRTSKLDGTRPALFDPRTRSDFKFVGDAASDASSGPTSEMSLISETPKNTSYKVYVALRGDVPADADCIVYSHAIGFDRYFQLLPVARLSEQQRFDYLGVFSVDENLQLTFAEPDVDTRQRELNAVRERVRTTPAPEQEGAEL
jgi:hypothetical protein